MKTTETTKVIRKELAELYPEVNFSVRKVHAGAIYVMHQITDLKFRSNLDEILSKYVGWNEFGTEYVLEQVTA
jgi:hypothetical protein